MSKEKIEKFEDLIAWQKAKELTKDIYKVTRQGEFLKDFGLRDQAEGFERGGRSEFHQFLVIAKGSCAELRSHLYVALDADYIIDKPTFQDLYTLAEETKRIIGGLRAAVYKQKVRVS